MFCFSGHLFSKAITLFPPDACFCWRDARFDTFYTPVSMVSTPGCQGGRDPGVGDVLLLYL